MAEGGDPRPEILAIEEVARSRLFRIEHVRIPRRWLRKVDERGHVPHHQLFLHGPGKCALYGCASTPEIRTAACWLTTSGSKSNRSFTCFVATGRDSDVGFRT